MVMGQLQGKVALITGAGRGQGLAAARRFAAEGARIVVNDLDPQSVNAAVESLRAAGGEAVEAVGDVSVSADVCRALAIAKDTFGGLDILIGGVFLFCKYGIPLLIERGGGVILNTASIAALRGGPDAHAYTATKGAVLALTRAIAVTYGPKGVRANTLCPGVIDTEMIHEALIERDDVRTALARNTPLRRIGTAEDIAEVALFLVSDASRFITGEAFAVDGGLIQRV